MRDMHNADLCDTLGNAIHRATNLCNKYCNGVIVDVPSPPNPPIQLDDLCKSYIEKMDSFELHLGAQIAIQGFREVNRYLHEEAPWLLKGDEHAEKRQVIVRASLEAIYALTHLLMPFAPVGTAKIFKKLNTEPVALEALGRECRNLKVGTKIEVGEVLYEKVSSLSDFVVVRTPLVVHANIILHFSTQCTQILSQDEQNAASKKKETHAEAQQRKKEQKAAAMASSKKGQETAADQPEFTKVDIRVGKIVKVWNHESADKLVRDCGHSGMSDIRICSLFLM